MPPKKKAPAKRKPAAKKSSATAKAVSKPNAKKSQVKAKTKRRTTKQIQEDLHNQCIEVIELIENGLSLRQAVKVQKMSSKTFYKWREFKTTQEIKDDVEEGENGKRYARACEDRKALILDEIIEIADDQSGDMKKFMKNGRMVEYEDKEFTSRSKLRIETRLKYLEMVDPEKYGKNVKIQTEQDIKISFK